MLQLKQVAGEEDLSQRKLSSKTKNFCGETRGKKKMTYYGKKYFSISSIETQIQWHKPLWVSIIMQKICSHISIILFNNYLAFTKEPRNCNDNISAVHSQK